MTKFNRRINVYAVVTNRPGDTSAAAAAIAEEDQLNEFTFQYSVSGRRRGGDAAVDDYSPIKIKSNEEATATVSCRGGRHDCYPALIVTIPYIDYASYSFNITAKDVMGKGYPAIHYTFVTANASFTQFEMWLRLLLSASTLVVIILIQGLARKDWAVIEQRSVLFLLLGLLGYNNPAFPLTVLLDGGAIRSFLDQTASLSFLIAIVFFWFWIVTFGAIRTAGSQLQTFRAFLPRFIAFWIAAVFIFFWTELQIRDAGASMYKYSDSGDVIVMLLFAIYVLWLSYIVSKNGGRYIPFLSLRFLGLFTVFGVIFTTQYIAAVSGGIAQLLLVNIYAYTAALSQLPSKDSGTVVVSEPD
ncbi:MAG: hypothetical protein WC763_05620 [Candidatus Paceibacterota bacterium]